MKYSCQWCPEIFEGQTQIVESILAHERTHPENSIDSILERRQTDGEIPDPKCSWCGK